MTQAAPPEITSPYRLVQSRHGTMLVNENDTYMGRSYLKYGECCELEIDLLLSMLRLPGMAIEVGANMGVHTVPLAKELARQNRTMLALEPQRVVFQQLCANLALNGILNVVALPYASGAHGGFVRVPVLDYRRQNNFGGIEMLEDGTAIPHELTPCMPIDNLVPESAVALIKIDVEGHELLVLQGAERVIAQHHPILYVENDRVAQSAGLIQWLLDRRYRLWWHIVPLFNPRNLAGDSENIYPGISSFNMLGIWEGHPANIEGLPPIVDPTFHPLAQT